MRIIILLGFLFFLNTAFGQQKYLGIQGAVPFFHEQLPEGREYQPWMLLGYYTLKDLLPNKKNHLYIYLEPQLVLVNFSPSDKSEYEFGANLGIQYQLNLNPTSSLTALIGSGPHYITVETNHQTQGYIFSDNFEIGYKHHLKKLVFHLNWRFRHISNANFKKPNKGIDSWFFVLGISKKL